MSDTKHTPGAWRGFATSWKSIDEMVEEHRRLLLARPDHLVSYDIVAPDPKDPKADVVVATMGNGPTAEANGVLLLAAPDMLAALEGITAKNLEPVDGFGPHVTACAERKAAAWDAVEAAIAKAKGGAR